MAADSGSGTCKSTNSVRVASSHSTQCAKGAEKEKAASTAPKGSISASASKRPKKFSKKNWKTLELNPESSTSNLATEQGQTSSATAQTPSLQASSSKGIPLPAKARYHVQRNAARIFSRLQNIAEGDLTVKQKASKKWAAQIVSKQSSQADNPTSKRQRSLDDSNHPEAKRSRTHTSQHVSAAKTFSQVLEGQIVIAVINESDPDGAIAPAMWEEIESRLTEIFLPLLSDNPGSAPYCRDGGWHQGRVKLIACANQRSVDLYKLAISRVGEVWPGARLKVVMRDEIPSRPRARSWIPDRPAEPQAILDIIRISNPQLQTSTWRVTKLEEPKGKHRAVTFVISKESLEPLAKLGGVISYGFSSIVLRPYKKDLPMKQRRAAEAAPSTAEDGSDLSRAEGNTGTKVAEPKAPEGLQPPALDLTGPPIASLDAINIAVSPSPSEELLNFDQLLLGDEDDDPDLKLEDVDLEKTVIEVDTAALSPDAASSTD